MNVRIGRAGNIRERLIQRLKKNAARTSPPCRCDCQYVRVCETAISDIVRLYHVELLAGTDFRSTTGVYGFLMCTVRNPLTYACLLLSAEKMPLFCSTAWSCRSRQVGEGLALMIIQKNPVSKTTIIGDQEPTS